MGAGQVVPYEKSGVCIFGRSPDDEHVSVQVHLGFFQLRNTLHMNPADAGAMVSEMIPDF